MSEDFKVNLPKLGESIMDATIVKWFKKEGEEIQKDEPLLEVATDKVNSEIPSPVSGVIKKIHAKVDDQLNVGELLAEISQDGKAVVVETKEEKKVETGPVTEDQKDYYTPALLRLARENGVSFDELSKITGTGAGGRVSKKDLESYLASKTKCTKPLEGEEHIKMSGMRKAIAENMVRSFYQAPHASLICEVDVTDLMALIKKEKEVFLQKNGFKLSITSFVARAISNALREYPLLNASLRDDTIVVKHFVNLGIAVSVDQGVMVPVIRKCESLSIEEIARQVDKFAKKARDNQLDPEDVKAGTITMTNFGMTGVQIGIPIIRYPEVAIVGLGAITKKVVPIDDENFRVRQMMHLCLTFDHRVIDGIYGCGFLNSLKAHLEMDQAL